MKPFSSNLIIREVPFVPYFATAFSIPENNLYAKRILSALFQTIRKHLPLYACNSLMAYLPRDMKSLFRENWLQTFSTTFNYDAFINDLYAAKGIEHSHLFHYRKNAEDAVSVFFEVMKARLSNREYIDLMSLMPFSLRLNLMNDYVFEGHSYIV